MKKSVMGVHAPTPRPTPWAAALVATLLSGVFLTGLGLWTLFVSAP